MGELNIEKVAEDKFVPPNKALEAGYWGYTPDDTDDREYTVAAQGPLAEKANRPASEHDASATEASPASGHNASTADTSKPSATERGAK